MRKYLYTIIAGLLGALMAPSIGQNTNSTIEKNQPKENNQKKAWEFGFGGSVFQLTRFNIIDFYKKDDSGYNINTQKKDVIFGGNVYAARELNSHFYLDIQGSVGYTRDKLRYKTDNRFLVMAGVGLQWRLGEYFESKYIDPYFRVGANYMYKNFNVVYNGLEKFEQDIIKWKLDNLYNKENADRKHLIPISAGGGVNMWLSDRVGIGLQADYLVMPYRNIANYWEGTARIIWRFGGKSKKAKPIIEYVEVEKRIEVPVEVIKQVEVIKEVTRFGDLLNNIHFAFNKDILTTDSEQILDEVAQIMKDNEAKHFLIIGHTDAKGSQSYNLDLSRRRAKKVMDGLVKRGVPSHMLKARGVGKKTSYAPASESNAIRLGDRKVTVEIITNKEYWDYLPDTIM